MWRCQVQNSHSYYVDPESGIDQNPGSLDLPFRTLDKALEVVNSNASHGFLSDKIYLRSGIYKKTSDHTLYQLNLQGTHDDYALLSAMPCEPETPGCVERKSGQWYEKVIFDDAWIIDTSWQRLNDDSRIWVTDPGYTHLEWTHQNIWPWNKYVPATKNDDTPETTSFTVAPYMLLQDGEPTFWVDSLHQLLEPGHRFYDQQTHRLYIRPFGDQDPNQCLIETWYGGPENYEIGTLHLDGEGRGIFDGNLKYAAIKGLEFRMFNKIFEFARRHYQQEEDRKIQQDVLFEDNYCKYGWIHVLLDANTVIEEVPGVIRPKYQDRARWLVRNNIYYRPSREVFQIHGDDHIFEHNIIIDHLGPWAGPAACVSAVNTRNTRNMQIRYNFVLGQGNNRWHSGSVFMIESGSEHADANGDYLFGGQTYEGNLIADVSSGSAIVLGKGGARLKDITVKNNIFATNQQTATFKIGSPHHNLNISGNIFYDQKQIIEITDNGRKLKYDSLPSTIAFTGNLVIENRHLFDHEFINSHSLSAIQIDSNYWWLNQDQNYQSPDLESGLTVFNNPEKYDFTWSDAFKHYIKKNQLMGIEKNLTGSKQWQYWQEKFPLLVPLKKVESQYLISEKKLSNEKL